MRLNNIMATLFIARHGNTFSTHETPTRVGKSTDLALTLEGLQQAQRLNDYFKHHKIDLNRVFLSALQRVEQTAQPILENQNIIGEILNFLVEIDYGVDENQTEKIVIARLGEQAIHDWNQHAILPHGWILDINTTIDGWKNIAQKTVVEQATNLVVSSNGILRFAPQILDNPSTIIDLKMAPGRLSCFDYDLNNQQWKCRFWNQNLWNQNP